MGESVSLSSTRYEVDNRPQLLSVKEAVMLFDRSLIPHQLPSNNHRQQHLPTITNKVIHHRHHNSVRSRDRLNPTKQGGAPEVQETKQILENTRWESMKMADSLISLREELELTKKELREFRGRAFENRYHEIDGEMTEFQTNRYLNFTNSAPLNRITILHGTGDDNNNTNRKKSLRTKVKRMWVAASLFSNKK